MLCNIALNGLERAAKEAAPQPPKGKRNKIHLTRYADDFVCTGADRAMLEGPVKEGISRFLEERGLEFKAEKTRVVHIDEGFKFLGFSLRRRPLNYKYNSTPSREEGVADERGGGRVLIIQPRAKKTQQLRDQIKRIIVVNRPISSIIRDCNPVLRGWSEYFRISYHSLPIFWSLGHYVWKKMWSWARKRHVRRRADWVFEKYVIVGGDRKWIWGKSLTESLFDISRVTSISLAPLKGDLHPYLEKNRGYYEKRRREGIEAKFRAAVYRKFVHKCPHCDESLYNGEPIELHHKVAQKSGGKWTLDNCEPLHRICHQSVTHGRGVLKDKK